jgi:ABC-type bacteriocin/lantibiotic exporter with double-glycine peptidase domain
MKCQQFDEQMEKEKLNPILVPPSLFNIQLNIRKGETVAVVGPVGSGKSTLLSAILGEINATTAATSPSVCVDGSVAYCAQQPWICNGLLKDNILFGKELVVQQYRDAIRVSAMESDIEAITGGHNAEIGERGINLSGGQKARVSLARAVYSNNDIYLLDDPLSAVDSHVAHHIFEECILKKLKEKTVVLVTHAVQFLPKVDRIIVLGVSDQDQGNHIRAIGT